MEGAAPASAAAPPGIVVGPGFGAGPHVRVFDSQTRLSSEWMAGRNLGAGARVATGNLDGSGPEEIIVATGTAVEPEFTAYRIDGSVFAAPPRIAVDCLASSGPGFGPCSREVGATIAAGDIDNDGRDEIVVGAARGEAAIVAIYELGPDGRIDFVGSFDAYPGFRGGAFVAVGDTDGSGRDEIITGADAGGGPHVRVFEFAGGTATEEAGFMAYAPAFGGGIRVAAANLDADVAEEIVTGAGPGGGPHVRVFNGNGTATAVSFFAYAQAFTAGVFVAAGDADGDLRAEIVTGPGAGGGPHVRMFERDGSTTAVSFMAYAPDMAAGVLPAVLNRSGSGSSQTGGSGGNSSSSGGTP